MDVSVKISGIAKLNRAFKQVNSDLPKELKVEFLAIAVRIANIAKGKMPHRSGKAASTVIPKGLTRGAKIVYGGPKAEYVPWLNFGGRVGRQKATFREIVRPDRYIYSTVQTERDDIQHAANLAIRKVAEDAGFKTTGGDS